MQIQVETRRGGRIVDSRMIVIQAPMRHPNGVRQIYRPEEALPAFITDPARSRQGSWCRRWRRPGNYH